MSNSLNPQRPYFTKQGPKRLRRTRRDTPEGQYSQWGKCVTHFKSEREKTYLRSLEADR